MTSFSKKVPISKIAQGSKGFTVVELMVTVAIFMAITSVILFEHSKFNSGILLTNLSYEVALAARKAQVFGLSTRYANIQSVAESDRTKLSYGIHFDLTSSGNDKQFVFFVDAVRNGNGSTFVYDNPSIETIEQISITNRNRIRAICFYAANWNCRLRPLSSNSDNRKANITFLRPNPEPKIYDGRNAPNNVSKFMVKLENENSTNPDDVRCVTIANTGQISVGSGNSLGRSCYTNQND